MTILGKIQNSREFPPRISRWWIPCGLKLQPPYNAFTDRRKELKSGAVKFGYCDTRRFMTKACAYSCQSCPWLRVRDCWRRWIGWTIMLLIYCRSHLPLLKCLCLYCFVNKNSADVLLFFRVEMYCNTQCSFEEFDSIAKCITYAKRWRDLA